MTQRITFEVLSACIWPGGTRGHCKLNLSRKPCQMFNKRIDPSDWIRIHCNCTPRELTSGEFNQYNLKSPPPPPLPLLSILNAVAHDASHCRMLWLGLHRPRALNHSFCDSYQINAECVAIIDILSVFSKEWVLLLFSLEVFTYEAADYLETFASLTIIHLDNGYWISPLCETVQYNLPIESIVSPSMRL